MSGPLKTRNATFLRLRDGNWGLRVVGYARAGAVVDAKRRDGSTQQMTIGRIVGKVDPDIWFCTIATVEEKSKLAARPNNSPGKTPQAASKLPPDDGTIPFDGPYKYVK
jgi:hypothetical protein